MNLASVFRAVALAHFAVAVAMVVPALLAMEAGGGAAASGYWGGALAACLIGSLCGAISFGGRTRAPVREGIRELLLTLLVFWGVVPIAASVPFIAQGFDVGEAWFEAVSAITTTGGWLSDPLARSTPQDMVYRATLQWLGGLASVATAAAVFVRPEFLGIAPIVPPFSRGKRGSYLSALERATLVFFPVFTAMSLAGWIAFLAVGVPTAQAATMAMSLMASGGFVPHPAGLEGFPPAASLVAGVLMTLSAVNFVVIAAFMLGQSGRVRSGQDRESRLFLFLLVPVALLYWLSQGAGDVDRLWSQLLNAVSVLSTNGIMVGDRMPSLTPVLVTAVIGGAAVSTAGGIKLLRWSLTFRRAGEELWKLSHPVAVLGNTSRANEFGIWIHALAFAVLLAVLVLTTAFFGFDLETSAAAAAAVISNTGPLMDLAPNATADYIVFDPTLRWLFGVGMIAGRLELVVLLVVLNRTFWQG